MSYITLADVLVEMSLEKTARIFGADLAPYVLSTHPGIDSQLRKDDFMTYARAKAMEEPDKLRTVLLGGGGIGAALGIGATLGIDASLRTKMIPPLVGAGLGALVGAAVRQRDKREIARAQRSVANPVHAARHLAEEQNRQQENQHQQLTERHDAPRSLAWERRAFDYLG